MRPQHITAENRNVATIITPPAPGFNEAAAYHCGKPDRSAGAPRTARPASMRPQHITAENGHAVVADPRECMSFNEAAAYHCGKHICGATSVSVMMLQ